MLIDPPSGWLYGFPKVMPTGVKDINKWVVEQGYPQELVDKGYMKHCRRIGTKEEIDEVMNDTN